MLNYAHQAEAAIIGCLLHDNSLIDEVSAQLRKDDFCHFFHRQAFVAILEMQHEGIKGIDILTLSSLKYSLFEAEENEVLIHLAEICNSPFTKSNLKTYLEMVKKESIKRKTLAILNSAQQKIQENEEGYFEFIREGLTIIENDQPFVITPYSVLLDSTIEQLEIDCKDPNKLTGLSTGFIDLDFYTNGLQKGNMIILAARPSQGKTMLMLNIADNISYYQKLPVAIFSLEQPQRDLCKRTLSRFSRVTGDMIFKSKMIQSDWEKIARSLQRLSELKSFINDKSGLTIYEIRAFCRKLRNEHGLSAVFIDYIGMIQGGDAENETLRLGNISRELKVLAKDFDIPVFVLCQLNRRIEGRTDKKPMLSDIRQSGNIEQDADVIIFLESLEKEATLYIEKNRNGRTGEVKLALQKEFFEFKNYTKL